MMNAGKERLLAAAFTLLVIAAVIRALFMIGPIGEQRQRKFDEKRLSDLQRISSSINYYFTTHSELPGQLDVLVKEAGMNIPIRDPETGKLYEYHKISSERYELCATFSLGSGDQTELRWSHKAGHACFSMSVQR
jgi:hypothetical protein